MGDDDGWTPLHHAALRDAGAVAGLLLARGADQGLECAASRGRFGETPADVAAEEGSSETLELLRNAIGDQGR